MSLRLFVFAIVMALSLVAMLATFLNGIQIFPQLHKTYKTKSVKDMSIYTLLLMIIANLLWLFHGYFILDYSLIIAGWISMILNFILFAMYLMYKNP